MPDSFVTKMVARWGFSKFIISSMFISWEQFPLILPLYMGRCMYVLLIITLDSWMCNLRKTFKSSPKDMFYRFEREREKDLCERETSMGCLLYAPWCTLTGDRTHSLGMCPWPGIELTAFWCMGWCSNQLSHLAGSWMCIFIN